MDINEAFAVFKIEGTDAAKFLQGQLTCNVDTLVVGALQPTAICNLKGRVLFGLWLSKLAADTYTLTLHHSLSDAFAAHIRKYAPFAKLTCTAQATHYVHIAGSGQLVFAQTKPSSDWRAQLLQNGEYVITAQTSELCQPQELRLQQRGGVDYNKGCYLGQEIVARLYFKAAPKAWLQLLAMPNSQALTDLVAANPDVVVLNQAYASPSQLHVLLVCKPTLALPAGCQFIPLPSPYNNAIARA